MTNQELERRLADAVSRTAPDDLEGVLSRCEMRKGNVVPMTKTKSKYMIRGLIAACLALVLAGGAGGVFYQQSYAVASVVSLDVNPSIELKVSRNEKVLSCTPLNAQAAEVLFDMDGGAALKGTKLDVAVNAIVGALVRSGYLGDVSSAILISVEDKDQGRAEKLQQELTAAVDTVLQEQSVGADILSQTLVTDAALDQQAQQNNISTGKAALVNQAIALNGTLEFDQLAALTVEELKDLIKAGAPAMPIGRSAALYAAEEYAGTLALDSVTSEVDSELDENPACYEVDLRHPTLGKFEYIVDAYTGKILRGEADILNTMNQGGTAPDAQKPDDTVKPAEPETPAASDNANVPNSGTAAPGTGTSMPNSETSTPNSETSTPNTETSTPNSVTTTPDSGTSAPNSESSAGNGNTTASYIGEAAAKKAALDHAGVAESSTKYCNSWLKYDGGKPKCYKVEFDTAAAKYEYEIGLYDGAVLKYEKETHSNQNQGPTNTGSDTTATYIGETAARQAALNHAGVTESSTKYCNCWLEYDDGRPKCYKVEFEVDATEYEYEIGLYDGAVLKSEKETHSTHNQDSSASSSTTLTDIGEEAAKAAALNHAGVTESQVSKLKTHRENHDGRLEYEVEFKCNGMEYEYTIDGSTGTILEYEIDRD